ncbi:ATP-grasp domain-containing protein [uncultured Thiodictyon sp.]|uniref:ATP-grasp domain-containing protein n=1 Tax=uncultured Thiodictyon sp. TaxID=1846217 RepID=UPI0025D35337|nr:ATP-grasp domain-containing protein [uncultured Thiodictyon sp.]
MSHNIKVMIAGVGGASLGTEIYKSLRLAGGYEIFGCDISKTAYGLYESDFAKTWRVSRDDYVSSVTNACIESGAKILIPGGEQPMTLLGAATEQLSAAGIKLLSNSPAVVSLYSDKGKAFESLAKAGIPIPRTITVTTKHDLDQVGLPCIIKPSTGSGGSAAVFFAVNTDEAMIYAEFIRRTGSAAVAQEYVDDQEGEYTIGVLSLPDQYVVGSIALRRALEAKLSVAYRGRGGLVSSGYSQGHIDEYRDLCQQAERIADAIGSCGPINIQGRVRDGLLLPFEINPRFSASTYLRAMAGFNEVDIMLRYLDGGVVPHRPIIRPGWYLRSLTERFVSNENLK